MAESRYNSRESDQKRNKIVTKLSQLITNDPARLGWMRSSSKGTGNTNVPTETDELLLPGDALRRKWRIKFALGLGPAATRVATIDPVPPRGPCSRLSGGTRPRMTVVDLLHFFWGARCEFLETRIIPERIGETPKCCSALISRISQIVAEGLRDASLIVEVRQHSNTSAARR